MSRRFYSELWNMRRHWWMSRWIWMWLEFCLRERNRRLQMFVSEWIFSKWNYLWAASTLFWSKAFCTVFLRKRTLGWWDDFDFLFWIHMNYHPHTPLSIIYHPPDWPIFAWFNKSAWVWAFMCSEWMFWSRGNQDRATNCRGSFCVRRLYVNLKLLLTGMELCHEVTVETLIRSWSVMKPIDINFEADTVFRYWPKIGHQGHTLSQFLTARWIDIGGSLSKIRFCL